MHDISVIDIAPTSVVDQPTSAPVAEPSQIAKGPGGPCRSMSTGGSYLPLSAPSNEYGWNFYYAHGHDDETQTETDDRDL